MQSKCPGQEDRKINVETIPCPECSYACEIFTDEVKVTCPNCKARVCRVRLPSCVDWCKSAQECVGIAYYKEYVESKAVLLRDKLLKELEGYFANDSKRINHAKKVLGFVEELLQKENADWHIVVPAAILHDVGIKAAEEKYGSAAGNLQEKEGPEIAKGIMRKLGVSAQNTDEICVIIAHHHTPGIVTTNNFKVLYDADWLVNLKDEYDVSDKNKLRKVIEKVFLTPTGKEIAKKIYLTTV
jgi:HD superfamily phosphohydrolase YqeK